MKGTNTVRARIVLLIAHDTWRTAVRQRMHHAIVLLAACFVVGARWLRDFNFGSPELKFLADCGLGALSLFGAMLTIVATAHLFFTELGERTMHTLLAKPVRRAEYLAGKFAGLVGLIGSYCAVIGVTIAVMLLWRQREIGGGGAVFYGTLGAAVMLEFLKLSVLAAFTLLVASYARTMIFTAACGFLIFAICHLQHLAHGAYATGTSEAAGATAAMVSWVFPNFQVFGLADSVGEIVPWSDVGRVALYALGYVVAAVALAIVSFGRREI